MLFISDPLKQALEVLFQSQAALEGAMINYALSGPMKEIGSVFTEGDQFNFELRMFDNSGDPDLQLMVDSMKCLRRSFDEICFNHGISPREFSESITN